MIKNNQYSAYMTLEALERLRAKDAGVQMSQNLHTAQTYGGKYDYHLMARIVAMYEAFAY